jgi:hypothetical protein
VLVCVGVAVSVGVGVALLVGAGVEVLVGLAQAVVAKARSALALARAESVWRTVARTRFCAAVTAGVEPAPEGDEPDLVVAALLVVPAPLPVPALVVVPALLPVAVLLPVAALLPVPALLVLLLAVPDAAETWPDCACSSVSLALATFCFAAARADFRDVLSKVARTWPVVTLSPMATGTVATTPDTANETVAAVEGCVVPVVCSVCTTGWEPTLDATYVGAVLRELA